MLGNQVSGAFGSAIQIWFHEERFFCFIAHAQRFLQHGILCDARPKPKAPLLLNQTGLQIAIFSENRFPTTDTVSDQIDQGNYKAPFLLNS
jgi:hypothetical protein